MPARRRRTVGAAAYSAQVITADPGVPPDFLEALRSLRAQRLRAEVRLTEIPAPGRIAPFAVALTGEVPAPSAGPLGDEDPTSGRFVLLHDPAGQDAWDGAFRVVTLVRATLDPEAASDPLLSEVAWTWVTDALAAPDRSAVRARAVGGTVTRVQSQSFGALAEREDEVEVEIRASWTPEGPQVGAHLEAWATVLCTAAGLPPLPEGVQTLSRRL